MDIVAEVSSTREPSRDLSLNWWTRTIYTKSYAKHINELNVKFDTLKQLEENMDSVLHDIGVGMDFLNRILFAQELKPKINKWNIISLKSFYTDNKTTNQVKR